MTFQRLRAKSGNGGCASEFLPEHLADAFRAAQLVLNATAEAQLQALGTACRSLSRAPPSDCIRRRRSA